MALLRSEVEDIISELETGIWRPVYGAGNTAPQPELETGMESIAELDSRPDQQALPLRGPCYPPPRCGSHSRPVSAAKWPGPR